MEGNRANFLPLSFNNNDEETPTQDNLRIKKRAIDDVPSDSEHEAESQACSDTGAKKQMNMEANKKPKPSTSAEWEESSWETRSGPGSRDEDFRRIGVHVNDSAIEMWATIGQNGVVVVKHRHMLSNTPMEEDQLLGGARVSMAKVKLDRKILANYLGNAETASVTQKLQLVREFLGVKIIKEVYEPSELQVGVRKDAPTISVFAVMQCSSSTKASLQLQSYGPQLRKKRYIGIEEVTFDEAYLKGSLAETKDYIRSCFKLQRSGEVLRTDQSALNEQAQNQEQESQSPLGSSSMESAFTSLDATPIKLKREASANISERDQEITKRDSLIRDLQLKNEKLEREIISMKTTIMDFEKEKTSMKAAKVEKVEKASSLKADSGRKKLPF